MKKHKPQRSPVSAVLRQAILDGELSPSRLATANGLDHSIVVRFVKGECGISLASADKLCESLGLVLVYDSKLKTKG